MSGNRKSKINSDEFKELIGNELKGIIDIELMILKGHLLLEHGLNKYIESFSEAEISIEETKFTFAQKIDLCKILGLFNVDNDNLKEQLITINKVRNGLAHNLKYDKKILENLYKYHNTDESSFTRVPEHLVEVVKLYGIISWLCGSIAGRLESQINFEDVYQRILLNLTKEK